MSREIVEQFGKSLDKDDFEAAKNTLTQDCVYVFGDIEINGASAICKSYEDNMIAGRKKLDELTWGESRVEQVSDQEYFVHFTDYLTHVGKSYVHRCQQRITVNQDNKICQIDHIDDPDEQNRLNAFYEEVGLPKSGD